MHIFNKYTLLLSLVAALFLLPKFSGASIHTLDLALSGQYEVPSNSSNATGALVGTYNDVSNVLTFTLRFNGLSAPASAAHFHMAAAGTNGPVQIGFAGFPTGVTSGVYTNTYTLTPIQESNLLCGMWYVNIHNASFPGGEIRSQLTESPNTGNILSFSVPLTGQKENPANASNAVGTLIGTFNNTTNALAFTLRFNGLSANVTAAHFHAPASPGANGPVTIGFAGFPTGVTSGFYSNSYTLTSAQKANLLAGLMYVNVHTIVFPGGEIRSQLTEGSLVGNCAGVPTMSEWSLIILCLISLAIGIVFLYRRQYALSYADSSRKKIIRAPFFHAALFFRVLPLCLGLATLLLFASFIYFGNLTMTDTIGTLISSAIVAFIAQLIIAVHQQEKS